MYKPNNVLFRTPLNEEFIVHLLPIQLFSVFAANKIGLYISLLYFQEQKTDLIYLVLNTFTKCVVPKRGKTKYFKT